MTVSDWVRPSPKSAPVQSKAAGLYMICSLSKHSAESNGLDDALMLRPSFIKGSEEVFLTGTAVEITPVKRIDNIFFEQRHMTKRLMKKFSEIVGD